MEPEESKKPSTPTRPLDVEGLSQPPLVNNSETLLTPTMAPNTSSLTSPTNSASPPPPTSNSAATTPSSTKKRVHPNLSLNIRPVLVAVTKSELKQQEVPKDARRGVIILPPGQMHDRDAVYLVQDVQKHEGPCPGCIRIGTNGILDVPSSSPVGMTPSTTLSSESNSTPMENQTSFRTSPLSRVDSQVSSKSIAFDSTVNKSLGHGAQGAVLSARDKKNYWKKYAVKCIPLREDAGVETHEKKEKRQYGLKSIQRELQHFRLKTNHSGAQHVVPVYNAYVDEAPAGGPHGGQDALFVIMEAATGNLSDVVKILKDKTSEELKLRWKSIDAEYKIENDTSTSWIPEPVLAIVAAQLMHALKYLQTQDGEVLVHNDVKPENILYKHGLVMLADLGCCQWVRKGSVQDTPQHNIGDERYRAPERVTRPNGEFVKFDEKADLWSLALVLLELALGHHPCKEYMRFDPPPYESMQRPKRLSDEFDTFLKACLSLDPANRISLDEAMKMPFADLSRYCQGVPQDVPQGVPQDVPQSVPQSHIDCVGNWIRASREHVNGSGLKQSRSVASQLSNLCGADVSPTNETEVVFLHECL
eukprot:PhF_6_TR36131/c0_g1_i1/m.52452